jgi:hypothetical protein
MEPLLVIVVPGLLGGIVLALLFSRFRVDPDRASGDGHTLEPPSTNMINMARIRVSGVGGLGMVAMAVTVAIFVPKIRLTMAIALGLGAVMAAVLIALRRREGALPSSHDPGAHSMFALELPPSDGAEDGDPTPAGRKLEFAPLRAES